MRSTRKGCSPEPDKDCLVAGEAEAGNLSSRGPCGHRPLGEDTQIPHRGICPLSGVRPLPPVQERGPEKGRKMPPPSVPPCPVQTQGPQLLVSLHPSPITRDRRRRLGAWSPPADLKLQQESCLWAGFWIVNQFPGVS